MKLRRKVAALMLLTAIGVGSAARRASAQDEPPDLRMLMNLDLFEPHPNYGANGASPGDDSMLDQIRTLDAMGYLGDRAPGGGNDVPSPGVAVGGASDEPPAPASESQPGYDVEGPQP